MSKLLVLLAIGLGMTVGLAAYNLLCGVLFGGRARRCREQLQNVPLRCYLMGLLVLLLQLWSVTGLPPLALLWLPLDALWLSFSLPALTGLAGEGLGCSGRWAAAVGTVPLCVSLACPLLGWLGVSQLLVSALGSAALPRAWRWA